jgi:hypothetical protein
MRRGEGGGGGGGGRGEAEAGGESVTLRAIVSEDLVIPTIFQLYFFHESPGLGLQQQDQLLQQQQHMSNHDRQMATKVMRRKLCNP